MAAERSLVLVSGPSRSGKSRWAEHLAQQSGRPVLYLATGPDAEHDPSWSARVALHRQRRPSHWQCREVGAELVAVLAELNQPDGPQNATLLIDSLGTWVAWFLEEATPQWQERCKRLQQQLQGQNQPVLLVVEETGWGVVPATAVGGRFRDRLGALQEQLMGSCSAAWLVVAGRAIDLLALGQAVPRD